MPDNTIPTPIRSDGGDFLDRAAKILAHGWLAEWSRRQSMEESPYEDDVASAIHVLLWGPVGTGDLILERRAIVPVDDPDTAHREVDCLITRPSTGARLGVEISAWQHHAATPERWTDDVQRGRRLRRMGLRVEPYTTLEIRERGVWTVAAEVIQVLQDEQGFESLQLPQNLISITTAAASNGVITSPARATDATGAPTLKPACSLPAEWQSIREQVQGLPSTWKLYKPREQEIRRRYLRAYEQWEPQEIEWLRRAQAQRLTRAMMSEVFLRQPTAIDRRLRGLGLGSARRVASPAQTPN